MFLPTEGLFAEAIRRVGLVEQVQRDCRVVFAGPTTLAALLNSLQMGFRTLAIQKRSSEVWNLLAGVKTEFGKFGEALSAVKDKLDQAARKMEDVDVRSRAITKKAARRRRAARQSAATPPRIVIGRRPVAASSVAASLREARGKALLVVSADLTPPTGRRLQKTRRARQSTSSHFALSLSMTSRSRRIGSIP